MPPIRRERAEALVAEVLERAKFVNEQPGLFLDRVDRILVFGSFIRGEEELGDVDLFIETAPRYPRDERKRRFEELTAELGRRFLTWSARQDWPYGEIRRFLRRRSRYLQIVRSLPWTEDGALPTSLVLFDDGRALRKSFPGPASSKEHDELGRKRRERDLRRWKRARGRGR